MQLPMKNKGFSITELMVAMAVSLIIVGAAYYVYKDTIQSFALQRNITSVKEATKQTLMGLDWFSENWGYGVPCNNSNVEQCNQVYVDTNPNQPPPFPPPSSLYVKIVSGGSGNPCPSVYFYGSLGGEGFVQSLASTNTVNMVSCRLNDSADQNCYYLWRGAQIINNQNPQLGSTSQPIMFSISGLSTNDAYCGNVSVSNPYNASMSNVVNALNGQVIVYNGPNQAYSSIELLQNGDLLIRVPQLIHMYCAQNPQDNNNWWLYVSTQDMAAPYCNASMVPIPVMRVRSFSVTPVSNGIQVNATVINAHGDTISVQRFYGK